ncbi:hypothetical protein ACNKHW_06120 [Shigella flexneri]
MDRIHGDKETTMARPDNGMLSVGVAYRFGQDEVAPVVATSSGTSC